MLGPRSINQFWQNGDLPIGTGGRRMGIEAHLRELADEASEAGGRLVLTAQATPWPPDTLPPGGVTLPAAGEPMLQSVTYAWHIEGPGGTSPVTTLTLDLPPPSAWTNPNTVRPRIALNGVDVPFGTRGRR